MSPPLSAAPGAQATRNARAQSALLVVRPIENGVSPRACAAALAPQEVVRGSALFSARLVTCALRFRPEITCRPPSRRRVKEPAARSAARDCGRHKTSCRLRFRSGRAQASCASPAKPSIARGKVTSSRPCATRAEPRSLFSPTWRTVHLMQMATSIRGAPASQSTPSVRAGWAG
jgi:hypothetical protein